MRKPHDSLAAIGGLSWPSKMPCPSWSTPAEYCGVGGRLREVAGSTCSECYAFTGCYLFASTRAAMARRWRILQAALATPAAAEEFAQHFAAVLNYYRRRPRGTKFRVFRWHDSGDVASVEHMAIIARVCELTPAVRHWLPTREFHTVAQWQRAGGTAPSNLCVRYSAAMIDGRLPNLGAPASYVHSGDRVAADASECRAYTRGGHCGGGRSCWRPEVPVVSYPLH